MNIKVSIVALLTGLFVVNIGHAQGLTQPWDDMTPLTEQDRAIVRGTVQSKIHGKPVGTVANWTNSAGGHSGTVKILGKSVRQQMPCEQIQYLITEPGSAKLHSRYVFRSCRLPDGTWKLAD